VIATDTSAVWVLARQASVVLRAARDSVEVHIMPRLASLIEGPVAPPTVQTDLLTELGVALLTEAGDELATES